MNHHQDAYMFLNDLEVATVEAIAECIFPADASGPGAREAAVVVYIDRALAGFGSSLQNLYRRGLAELDRFTSRHHGGRTFMQLSDTEKDHLLTQLEEWGHFAAAKASRIAPSREAGTAAQVSPSSDEEADSTDQPLLFALFAAVREHTIEGIFCDPLYGGNKDFVGWRLVGFPGAQWGYSDEQSREGFDAKKIPIKGLADLRRERFALNEQLEGGRK